MPYCTLDDIRDQLDEVRLTQLTDDEGLGAVNTLRVAKAVTDADEEVNGYIGARHRTPLDPVPSIVRKCSVDIAIYNLFARRDRIPEARRDRYRDTIRFLEQIALGRFSLGNEDPEGNPPASDAAATSGCNPARIFDRATLEGF
jgi:phage gp36-like protein